MTMQQVATARATAWGVLLGLNIGAPRFFKNDVQHAPRGCPADSMADPVVATQLDGLEYSAVRLHAEVAFPAGHAQ
jgi:hypothetical protein